MQAGVAQCCAAPPAPCAIDDSKHKTAAILKHELERDPAWQEFTQLCHQTKQQVQQTAVAFLRPPNQRAKARWMNLEPLRRWGSKTLAFLDSPPQERVPSGEGTVLDEKLGWLPRFRAQLRLWEDLLQLIAVTEHFVRTPGLQPDAALPLRRRAPLALPPRTQQVRAQLLEFVAQEAAQAHPTERPVGSSEVIASVFGKCNRLEDTQAKSGFTGLLLTIRAMVARTTRAVVHQALETVPTKRVLEWGQQTLGDSLHAQRKKACGTQSKTEQKCDQEQEAA